MNFLCRLFRDALKPPPLWTTYPHPNFSSLNALMKKMNLVYQEEPKKAPKVLFVMEGTFRNNSKSSYLVIEHPIIIIGAGQNKTVLSGYGLEIKGMKKDGKRVVLKHATVTDMTGNGLYGNNGLSFLCDRMTFTQSGSHGVCASRTKGRLLNCVITQCGGSGIYSSNGGLVELEGSQSKVDGNCTKGYSRHYGLYTYDTSSIIHLLFPLTKESVSTNNGGGGNWNANGGTIEIVDTFDTCITEHER